MEFDLVWLLLGLPLAFVLGWLASRLDQRQLRADNRRAPRAYFRGLNLLLNEQQDEAIDAFIVAMQADPDTAELHFALGNLFRRRGEYLRAVRVHEHLLARADLSTADRDRARWGLAQDFLKAGLLDRAEQSLQALADSSAYADQALLALLAIYERARDWPQAAAIAQTLQQRGQGDFSSRSAHYLCEQAAAILQKLPPSLLRPTSPKVDLGRGQPPAQEAAKDADETIASSIHQAIALLHQARERSPGSIRPRLALAEWQHRLGDNTAAWGHLLDLAEHAPQGLPLAAALMVRVAQVSGHAQAARELLRRHYEAAPQLDLLQALVDLGAAPDASSADVAAAPTPDLVADTAAPTAEQRRQWYLRHLEREPSLVAALRWLTPPQASAPSPAQNQPAQPHTAHSIEPAVQAASAPQLPSAVHRALDNAARPLTRYRCAACGFEARQHFWHCPGCQSWDSYPARRVEEL